MPTYFFDTSAIAKHFHREAGSDFVDELLARSQSRHVISRLSCVELLSVSAGKVRGKMISEADFVLFMGQFKAELNQKRYDVVRLLNRHFDSAQQLIKKHGLSHRIRALDAVQLAVAVEVNEKSKLDAFVCSDQSLCGVASLEGLAVIDPAQA